MSYYNGLVEFQFSVIVSAPTHKECVDMMKKFKEYFSAWSFSIALVKESKSARKGDVLNREIQVRFENYSCTVIAFREALRCIVQHYNLFYEPCRVHLSEHSTIPKDSHLNIFS